MIEANARGAWAEVEKHLRPFVERRVADPADIGDVLQEIYLRVQTGLADLRDSERFGPWVYRVARNVLADHGRSRARHHPAGADEVRAEDAEAAVLDDEADAERELASYMATFVAALPSPYREALVLTELQEMSHKDAAQLLGDLAAGNQGARATGTATDPADARGLLRHRARRPRARPLLRSTPGRIGPEELLRRRQGLQVLVAGSRRTASAVTRRSSSSQTTPSTSACTSSTAARGGSRPTSTTARSAT